MEDVLDVYSRPYDASIPVLCMDEQPVQLVEEVKRPIAATKNHPRRVDYEYKRAGVANIFMFAEPLAEWRHVSVRDRKTKVDWAIEMAELLEVRYADCEKALVVCDNLSTHTMGAFYEAFEPARARSLVSRIEFRYTPKHGSWLNIAENELSSMTRQCVGDRRIGSSDELRQQTTAWHEDVNQNQRGVEWQMKIDLLPRLIIWARNGADKGRSATALIFGGHAADGDLLRLPRSPGIQPNAPGSPGGCLRSLLKRETPPGQAGPPSRRRSRRYVGQSLSCLVKLGRTTSRLEKCTKRRRNHDENPGRNRICDV